MYNGTDRNLFLHCMKNVTLPLDEDDPRECWPRVIILASFPTSGNKLIRALMQQITHPLVNAFKQYSDPKDAETLFFDLGKKSENQTLGVFGTWQYGSSDVPAIPLMNRIAAFKSHFGSTSNADNETLRQLHQAVVRDQLHGIIRIARNPGDHMMRNRFRWGETKYCYSDINCFFQNANILCPDMTRLAKEWVHFHSFWDELPFRVPNRQHIVYYEHFTKRNHVEGSIEGTLRYYDDVTSPETDFSYMSFFTNERVNKMKGIIKEPDYEHVTLVTRICGKEIARDVHEVTKNIAERLGYSFDYENGVWLIEPPTQWWYDDDLLVD